MILVLFLYFICATTFTVSKWGLNFVEPIFFVAVRMLIAGALLGLYCLFAKLTPSLSIRQAALLAGITFFNIYLAFVLDIYALTSLTSIESSLIFSTAPFITAIISYFWFHEQMTEKKWLGLALGALSLIPLMASQGSTLFLQNITATVLTLIAVISGSYGWILVRTLVKEGFSPFFINAISMFFGGILALITSYYAEVWDPVPVWNWRSFAQALGLIILLANFIFYNLYGSLLKKYTATFLSFAGFICPFFAALLGAFSCMNRLIPLSLPHSYW